MASRIIRRSYRILQSPDPQLNILNLPDLDYQSPEQWQEGNTKLNKLRSPAMTKQMPPDFILIDDDPISNLICSTIIQVTFPMQTVMVFTEPEEGLEYISSCYATKGANSAILLLDINMPRLSGWDVLDEYKSFPDTVKIHFKIFLLSSSIDDSDKQRAAYHPFVNGYIEKPLTQDILREYFS